MSKKTKDQSASLPEGNTTSRVSDRRVRFDTETTQRPCLKPKKVENKLFLSNYLYGASSRQQSQECDDYPENPYIQYDKEHKIYCCKETPPTMLDVLEHIVVNVEPSIHKMDSQRREKAAGSVKQIMQYKNYFIKQIKKNGTIEDKNAAMELWELSTQLELQEKFISKDSKQMDKQTRTATGALDMQIVLSDLQKLKRDANLNSDTKTVERQNSTKKSKTSKGGRTRKSRKK